MKKIIYQPPRLNVVSFHVELGQEASRGLGLSEQTGNIEIESRQDNHNNWGNKSDDHWFQ